MQNQVFQEYIKMRLSEVRNLKLFEMTKKNRILELLVTNFARTLSELPKQPIVHWSDHSHHTRCLFQPRVPMWRSLLRIVKDCIRFENCLEIHLHCGVICKKMEQSTIPAEHLAEGVVSGRISVIFLASVF